MQTTRPGAAASTAGGVPDARRNSWYAARWVALTPRVRPHALFGLAIYYGVAGFGGGYSVLAQLRRELVDRRKWVSADDFLVLAELSKSLPGTPATSLLALLGQRVGGSAGGMLAAFAFLLPSTLLMIACGAAYPLVRSVSKLTIFFDGMNAVMVGVVGAVTVDLARSALRGKLDVLLAALCTLVLATHVASEPIVAAIAVAGGALLGALRPPPDGTARRGEPPAGTPSGGERPPVRRLHGVAPLGGLFSLKAGGLVALGALVRVFVPIGVLTFGGGLAMIPAIEHIVVLERGWLDAKSFADAIALGQVTPGPVAICATFIGYRVAGAAGALVATVAMFAPATAVALLVGRSVERFHGSRLVEGALRTLAPAVIGMLAAATVSLGRAAFRDPVDAALAVAAFVVLVWRPISPLWPLLAGGLVRLALSWLAPT